MIVIKQAHLTQRMEIWSPRWNDKFKDEYGEPIALLHAGKVHYGSSEYIIVEFTKSKGLKDLRFCIRRTDALRHKSGTNGKAQMLEVPMSHLQPWISREEDIQDMRDAIESFGWWKPKESG